ncbi:MAG TPA: flagellar basal body L-ring protein FlgH [Rhodothermales bacterium]|nr:flagellar basal body L-ring protein FlgH [Rhodothermales bacterium]
MYRLNHTALPLGLVLALSWALPAFAQVSMYADPTARRTGDVITIVLAERTAAQRQSSWQNTSDASLGAGASVSGGPLSGAFASDAQFKTDASNNNQSVQSDLLHGTISARVDSVDQTGNLIIRGERRIMVNGETHLMTISGVVRPYDVSYNNTVLSTRIADASITYRREGARLIPHFRKPAVLARVGAAIVLVAALFFAL